MLFLNLKDFNKKEIFLSMFFCAFFALCLIMLSEQAYKTNYGQEIKKDAAPKKSIVFSKTKLLKENTNSKLINFSSDNFIITARFSSTYPTGETPYRDISGMINAYTMVKRTAVEYERS